MGKYERGKRKSGGKVGKIGKGKTGGKNGKGKSGGSVGEIENEKTGGKDGKKRKYGRESLEGR
jgi:hypothetical protein